MIAFTAAKKSQADPCASSILVDELDARPLQHRFNPTSVCSRRVSRSDDRGVGPHPQRWRLDPAG